MPQYVWDDILWRYEWRTNGGFKVVVLARLRPRFGSSTLCFWAFRVIDSVVCCIGHTQPTVYPCKLVSTTNISHPACQSRALISDSTSFSLKRSQLRTAIYSCIQHTAHCTRTRSFVFCFVIGISEFSFVCSFRWDYLSFYHAFRLPLVPEETSTHNH